MKKGLKDILFFGVIFAMIDQVIKIIISNKMLVDQSYEITKNFFSITLVHNIGAAFSLLSGSRILFIIIGISAIVGLCIYIFGLDSTDDMEIFLYALLFGGILGNLIDRIFNGYVIDYLSFKFGNYLFPIFNFADICIVVSVTLFLFREIKGGLWK